MEHRLRNVNVSQGLEAKHDTSDVTRILDSPKVGKKWITNARIVSQLEKKNIQK